MKRSRQAALGAALVLAVGAASAQQSKGVRIVVAFPAGGPIDFVARMLAPRLGEVMGQQVLVDNRGGENGIIGTDHVAKSPPDGLTMVLASPGAVAISPAVYAKMPFDTLRDLAPVTLVSTTPELLVVHPSVPAKSVKTLNDPGVTEKMIARGADPVGNTPEQFADYLKKDIDRWAKLAKTTNIKVD